MMGLKTLLAAAGLAIAGTAAGAAVQAPPATPAPAATPAIAPAPTGAATASPGGPAPASRTDAAVATKAADPLIAADGTPVLRPTPGIGQPVADGYRIQPQVTSTGRQAHWFHDVVLFPLITIISIFVLVLLVVVVIKFRARANPVPSRTSHNTAIEIAWTLVPVLILVAIAVPSIRLLAAQYRPAPAGAVTLKATGNQWYWTYEYPDHGGVSITANMLKEQSEVEPGARFRTDADGPRLLAVDNRIVLPAGVPIRLITTAADVIHSWAIPAFWIKLDAIPGRLNETSFTIERPGLYFGQCSELCGSRHAYMPIAVEAVPPAVFAQWIAAKGGTMPGSPQPSPLTPNATDAPVAAPVPAADSSAVVNTTETAVITNQAAPGNSGAGNTAGR